MQFRTEIKLKKGEYPEISYESSLFLIGSCFSDNMGNLFQEKKFHALSNPFGVTYNPVSIANQLDRIVKQRYYTHSDVIKKNSAYNSFELHGSFDSPDEESLINIANSKIDKANKFLEECSHVYITLGTAWVYELNETKKIVNNCHKKSASLFSKKILTIHEIQVNCERIIETIRQLNEHCAILFTISPVRHLKDGFRENSLSKSALRVGLENTMTKNLIHYFPAYEMVMDDLRDYRFYSTDLLHPSNEAIEYIWEKLCNTQMNEETFSFMKECENLTKAIHHEAFNESSKEHQSFIKESLSKANSLQNKLKKVDFTNEIETLESRLSE